MVLFFCILRACASYRYFHTYSCVHACACTPRARNTVSRSDCIGRSSVNFLPFLGTSPLDFSRCRLRSWSFFSPGGSDMSDKGDPLSCVYPAKKRNKIYASFPCLLDDIRSISQFSVWRERSACTHCVSNE
jgi:hypothetical protein